ncbi:MAG: glycosyltransferase, partial [Acetobacter sp.]|nr:glycosyltransferase [Acetobacter sp.]
MSKILTISIAAYNVEKTIDQCLSSFLTSKYLDDIELLVINDGSTDKTAEIVSQYQEKFPN